MEPEIRNICQLFLEASGNFPEKIAIHEKGASIRFSELEKEVLETAAYFRSKGIGKGDRVLVFVPMSIDLYRIVLALFYVGATAVFVDEWVHKKRLELCCQLADCKGFIGVWKARLLRLFSREIRKIPVHLKLKGRSTELSSLELMDENDAALITFTTGSTGTPKAARRTHWFLKAQFDALMDEIDPKPEDVDMTVLPIVLFINLGYGCTSVIADFKMSKIEALDPEIIWNQIKDHQVNRITASPYFVRKLAEYASENKMGQHPVKNVFTGGAPVFPSEARVLDMGFPSAFIHVVYGSTEAEPISSILTNELLQKENELKKGLPVGKVYHGTAVRIIPIVDDAIEPMDKKSFENWVLGEGFIGEIAVAGKHVLKQYFNNEEAFRQNKIKVADTIWHRTGDSGFIQNKELYLTGRCKQLIPDDQSYISPFIMENILQNQAEITAGTLLEVAGKKTVVLEGDLTEKQAEKMLGPLNIPYDQVKIRSQIPRDPRHHSKIDYDRLKQEL